MTLASVPPPPRRYALVAIRNGIAHRIDVEDGSVVYSEAPEARSIPWDEARNKLIALGYRIRPYQAHVPTPAGGYP